MAITIIAVLFGAYVVVEALHALNLMGRGEKLFRRVKYITAATCGVWFISTALNAELSWLELAQASVIVLFVWPKTVARIRHFFYWPLIDMRSRR